MQTKNPVHLFLLIAAVVLLSGMWLSRPVSPYQPSNVPTAPSVPLNSQVSFDKNNQTVTNSEDSKTQVHSVVD